MRLMCALGSSTGSAGDFLRTTLTKANPNQKLQDIYENDNERGQKPYLSHETLSNLFYYICSPQWQLYEDW